jgi:polyisoprenoid-binding protein YceI
MVKLIYLTVSFIILNATLFAQQKFSIESGTIDFASRAQLELIKASSDKVQGLIDPATQQFAFTVDIKSFRGFNSELQREHFNEKYLESEKYPKARFSGKIIEPIDLTTDNAYEVRAKGDLEIHGQKQTRIIKSKIIVRGGVVRITSSFLVPLADHNIAIPNIVSQKIATEIEVEFNANLKPQ